MFLLWTGFFKRHFSLSPLLQQAFDIPEDNEWTLQFLCVGVLQKRFSPAARKATTPCLSLSEMLAAISGSAWLLWSGWITYSWGVRWKEEEQHARTHSIGRPGVKHGRGVNTDPVCLPLGWLLPRHSLFFRALPGVYRQVGNRLLLAGRWWM